MSSVRSPGSPLILTEKEIVDRQNEGYRLYRAPLSGCGQCPLWVSPMFTFGVLNLMRK